MLFIITVILMMVAGACNASMDIIAHKFEKSIFSNWDKKYWDPKISWKNKYKDGDPNKGPKFPFSTTILVSLTDGWHMLKSLMLTAISAAVAINMPGSLIWFLVLRITFTTVFELLYSKVLRKS